MKRFWVVPVCILLLFFRFPGLESEFLSSSRSSSSIEGIFNGVMQAPARRSLLTEDPETGKPTALVAALDGTVYLLELDAMKPLWSFRSGPSIYSSYQAPVNYNDSKEASSDIGSGYFIDCGDDWELYAHSRLGKLKLMKSIDEYIGSTPQIAEDGGIVLGSKRTNAFLVDAKTGRLIHRYRMPDSPVTQDNDILLHYNGTFREEGLPRSTNREADDALYITRTDYALTSFVPNSDKLLWNLTVSEIGVAFLCQGMEDPFSGAVVDSGKSEANWDFNMPLPCQSRALVYRFRSPNILEHLRSLTVLPKAYHQDMMLPKAHHQDMMLPSSASNQVFPSQPNVDKIIEFLPSPHMIDQTLDSQKSSENAAMRSLPMPHDIGDTPRFIDVKSPPKDGTTRYFERLSMPVLIVFAISFVVAVNAVTRNLNSVAGQLSNSHPPNVPSKRKKSRKSGKNGSSGEKSDKDPSSDGGLKNADMHADNKLWLNLIQPSISSKDGRTIGKLFISSIEIAKGSNGTVILEGIYEGRAVAVKRLVRAYHEIAFKEIQNLIASDRHPNIVRWYGVEQDQDFVYLSLERCICSLSDLIQIYVDTSESATLNQRLDAEYTKHRIYLNSLKGIMPDTNLWKENGYPSPVLLRLMRDVVSGLVHLHELGIIHRDLKPQNVLITKERFLCAKLSDMGISKRLVGDMSSLGHYATGCGSSGWQAPEQLLHGRQTRSVDMFSLGCVLFYCMTGGSHPFGSPLERDINITKNKIDLYLVEHIPEALDLFSHLLDPNAELRPKAAEVIAHPLFWTAEMRLSFLRDSSDRVELEDRETSSDLLEALEGTSPIALGGKWNEKMEPPFINNIGRYRRYRFDSVRDLLRVMRNKLNHYRELPNDLQELLGTVPEGFDCYFRSRFPKLLIEVYKVMSEFCRDEACFQKYFISSVL